tara:strand:+ start:2143 stop:2913 length:771 start_codon:yes stop_codon:yes gene_type:complete
VIKKYKFSVILVVYKNLKYIFEALTSIKKQNYKNYEIILVDTFFSKNKKSIILKKLKKLKIKVKYLKYHNKYLATGARNFAAKKSKGNYLTFLDDDDKYKINYLSSLNKIIQKKNYDLIATEFSAFIGNKIIKKYYLAKKLNLNDIYIYNPGIVPSNMAIKKETFFKLKGFNKKLPWSSDKILLIDILRMNYAFKVLKKNLILKRIHPNSLTKDSKSSLKYNIKFYNFYKKDLIFISRLRFIKKILILLIKYLFKF